MERANGLEEKLAKLLEMMKTANRAGSQGAPGEAACVFVCLCVLCVCVCVCVR